MFYSNIIVFSLLVIPYILYYFKRYKITPVTAFLIMQVGMFFGICLAPRGQTPVAVKLETFYVIACFCFILGVQFAAKIGRGRGVSLAQGESFLDADPPKSRMQIIYCIVAVSIVLCAYLFIAGGVNVFISALKDFFRGEVTNYKDDRANFFGVRGTGYIYQFRVVLLPILSTFLLLGLRKKLPKIVTYTIFALMIIFLLGTGQRNAFVFYCAIVFIFILLMKRNYNIKLLTRFQTVLLIGAAGLFLVVLTIGNGRTDDGTVSSAVFSLIDRFFGVNQRTAIAAFDYINTQPTVWGYDWLMMLADILPGKSGYLSVDRIVYYLAYGTYSGTGPPCLWSSAWYNFNFFGITFFPFILGALYHRTHQKMMRKRNKNRLYILLYSALVVYLGIWVYGTPMTLFNNGVVTVLILRFLLFTRFGRR